MKAYIIQEHDWEATTEGVYLSLEVARKRQAELGLDAFDIQEWLIGEDDVKSEFVETVKP